MGLCVCMANFRRSPTINNLCPCHINLILRLHAIGNDNERMRIPRTRWSHSCTSRQLAGVFWTFPAPCSLHCNAIYVISAVNIAMINCAHSITIGKDLYASPFSFSFFKIIFLAVKHLDGVFTDIGVGRHEEKEQFQKWSTTSATRMTFFAHSHSRASIAHSRW